MVTIKRVSYAFNNQLDEPFFLDVLSQVGGRTLVDYHGTFKTQKEFNEKIADLVPLLREEDGGETNGG